MLPALLVGGGLGRQALRHFRRAHLVGEQDRRALGTQEMLSRLKGTRVDEDRNGLLRLPTAASGRLWPGPNQFNGVVDHERKASDNDAACIHLARRETCRVRSESPRTTAWVSDCLVDDARPAGAHRAKTRPRGLAG